MPARRAPLSWCLAGGSESTSRSAAVHYTLPLCRALPGPVPCSAGALEWSVLRRISLACPPDRDKAAPGTSRRPLARCGLQGMTCPCGQRNSGAALGEIRTGRGDRRVSARIRIGPRRLGSWNACNPSQRLLLVRYLGRDRAMSVPNLRMTCRRPQPGGCAPHPVPAHTGISDVLQGVTQYTGLQGFTG